MKLKENKLMEAQTLNLRRNGFVAAPEKDFSDDGNRFKGYYYDPDKTGDKRFVASKTISDGEAYISVYYYDKITGKYHYFDDLNGVDYNYAVEHIKELTDEIDAFKAKLDAGELKPKQLSDEEIENIKQKAITIAEATGENYYGILDKIITKLGFDKYDLAKDIRDELYSDTERRIRNARVDNSELVKRLAKDALDKVLKLMKDETTYDRRNGYTTRKAKSLDDALKYVVNDAYVSTYSSDSNKDLVDIGLEANKLYWLKDLTDTNQEKILNWVRNKVETLYDFE